MRTTSGVFWRRQGHGLPRAYARLPNGRRVALRLPGSGRAVTDVATAQALYAKLLAEHQRQTLRGLHGLAPVTMALQAAAAEHLRLKALANKVTTQSLESDQRHLERACQFFGADTLLEAITPQRVGQWATWLQTTRFPLRLTDGRRRGKRRTRLMSPSNARKCLNSLSNLFRRAQEQGWVSMGVNPVSALMTKPQGKAHEARWFEAHEVALLLESARTLQRKRPDLAVGCAYELIATAALTGARPGELLGLKAEDVSFDRTIITIRGTKTAGAFRSVPLWPQLREILYPYLCPDDRTPRTGLLFRSPKTGARLREVRRMLDAVGIRAGLPPRAVNLYAFRHSFCSAALQLLDRGAPVSPYTVARWLGHGGTALVNRVYGHLGEVRHRAEVMEFRVQQHAATLKDRLAALQRSDSVCDSVLDPAS
jgi:integrase